MTDQPEGRMDLIAEARERATDRFLPDAYQILLTSLADALEQAERKPCPCCDGRLGIEEKPK